MIIAWRNQLSLIGRNGRVSMALVVLLLAGIGAAANLAAAEKKSAPTGASGSVAHFVRHLTNNRVIDWQPLLSRRYRFTYAAIITRTLRIREGRKWVLRRQDMAEKMALTFVLDKAGPLPLGKSATSRKIRLSVRSFSTWSSLDGITNLPAGHYHVRLMTSGIAPSSDCGKRLHTAMEMFNACLFFRINPGHAKNANGPYSVSSANTKWRFGDARVTVRGKTATIIFAAHQNQRNKSGQNTPMTGRATVGVNSGWVHAETLHRNLEIGPKQALRVIRETYTLHQISSADSVH